MRMAYNVKHTSLGGGMRALLLIAATGVLLGFGPDSDRSVSFSRDIKPILEARCVKCHGAAMQLSKLDLRTRELAVKGGEKGTALAPGDPDHSAMYRRVAGIEKPAMPMDGKLSAAEVELIRDWIRQGASWTEPIAMASAAKN